MRWSVIAILLIVLPLSVGAWDDTRNIKAALPSCAPGVACSAAVTPGFMAGQATLDFTAEAPALAGTGFTVQVFDQHGTVVKERSGGVMSTGSMTALIASAQVLEPGPYKFVIPGIAEGSFEVVTGGNNAREPPPAAQAPGQSAPVKIPASEVVGAWHGIASTVGQIVLAADGTYQYNGQAGGHYRVQGDQVIFDGALAAWNGGAATLKNGVLEFYWTNAEGFNNWFVFQR